MAPGPKVSVADLRGPGAPAAGGTARRHVLTARTGTVTLPVRTSDRRLELRGPPARAGHHRDRGRPDRGDAPQRRHRGRRHPALARVRRAVRRGRRAGRHAARGAARRRVRLPVPGGPGGDVLVPHPPGVAPRRAQGAVRDARRDAARGPAGSGARAGPDAAGAHVRRRHDPRRPGGTRRPRRPPRPAGATASDQHRLEPALVRRRRLALPAWWPSTAATSTSRARYARSGSACPPEAGTT